MNSTSGQASSGADQVARGDEFERRVSDKLDRLFDEVIRHKEVRGYSGIGWTVDLVVNSRLMVEASVQRRLETKITSTFIRFADIVRAHRKLKGCLILDDIRTGYHHSKKKKFFPTSEFRVMTAFGFPILRLEDAGKLVEFMDGKNTALESSTLPSGFRPRSMFSEKRMFGPRILEIVSKEPAPRRVIAKEIGKPPSFVDDAIRLIPQVKKLGTYYGTSEDQIYRKFATLRSKSPHQHHMVKRWISGEFIGALESKGRIRSGEFAKSLGIKPSSIARLVHDLEALGVIRRVAKGTWTLAKDGKQGELPHQE